MFFVRFFFVFFVTLSNDEVCDNGNAIEQCKRVWPLSYESLNDKRFSENRFCTWFAGIALPRGGDAY